MTIAESVSYKMKTCDNLEEALTDEEYIWMVLYTSHLNDSYETEIIPLSEEERNSWLIEPPNFIYPNYNTANIANQEKSK